MSYVTDQDKWVRRTKLEVGDRVLIAHQADSGQCGWTGMWAEYTDSPMTATVGQTGVVSAILRTKTATGIVVKGDGFHWNYPFFVLVKVGGEE